MWVNFAVSFFTGYSMLGLGTSVYKFNKIHITYSRLNTYYNCKLWPTRCNNFGVFIYLFLINPTCFGRCLRPSSGALDCIYSIWYCPPILLPADVMDEMELQFHLIHDISQEQYRWTISDAANAAPDDGRIHPPKHVELIRNK